MNLIIAMAAAVSPGEPQHVPFTRLFRSWLHRRRLARQLAPLEGMPAYLLRDIGLPDLENLPAEDRRAALADAIRAQ